MSYVDLGWQGWARVGSGYLRALRQGGREIGIASRRTCRGEETVGGPSPVSPPSVMFTGYSEFPQLHPPGACSWATPFTTLGLSFSSIKWE